MLEYMQDSPLQIWHSFIGVKLIAFHEAISNPALTGNLDAPLCGK